MEPDRQIEIQLGHMCNNRCVFCVSGQRTAFGEAGPMAVAPILSRIRQARELGHRKITLLGGEPTLQPGFMEIIEETVNLGFEEIVIFTNGVKTARPEFVDAILATGGNFTWRISIQGATRESHERTTRKPGSFGRIVRTLENLQARGQRITVNMCVVTSNYEDVDRFPALLARHGASQLHLDLMRPLDAGQRTEEELRASMPSLEALAEPFRRMIAGFDEGFDVNLGNLPYCAAPDLAPWIHHDGERTETIAIDHDDQLSRPWNKYLVKRRDKLKPDTCRACVFDDRCSGVFEHHARFHGIDGLEPIDARTLQRLDPRGRLLGLWGAALLRESLGDGWTVRETSEQSARASRDGAWIELRPRGEGALARHETFSVFGDPGAHREALAAALAAISPPVHPLGDAPTDAKLAAALRRLRARAPFGPLTWEALDVQPGRLELALRGPARERATFWLALEDGRPRGGYHVDGVATDALREGLGAALAALRGRPA